MFGAAKYAQRLANHLDAPVDAACMIDERSGVDGRPDGGRERPRGRVRLTSSHTTTRAHVELVDARSFEFEVERGGPTPDGEVLELLAARCGSRS